MSLIRCEFKGRPDIRLILEKSQYEPDITEETLRHFTSRDDHNRIEIIQTKMHVSFMRIYINNVARRIKMENVDLDVNVNINIEEEGHDCQTVSVYELEMINCRIGFHPYSPKIRLHLRLTNSFAKFRFKNTVFERLYFYSPFPEKCDHHEIVTLTFFFVK